jgi:hypothetical protein
MMMPVENWKLAYSLRRLLTDSDAGGCTIKNWLVGTAMAA